MFLVCFADELGRASGISLFFGVLSRTVGVFLWFFFTRKLGSAVLTCDLFSGVGFTVMIRGSFTWRFKAGG